MGQGAQGFPLNSSVAFFTLLICSHQFWHLCVLGDRDEVIAGLPSYLL